MFPFIYVFTPSSSACMQSIIHALSAPVVYAKGDAKGHAVERKVGTPDEEEKGVAGGDIIRDCKSIK
jgi:hypothetical protein